MTHIILQDNCEVDDIIQDIMLHPPEKYRLEVHLDKQGEVLSVILLDTGVSTENLVRVLNFFQKKYEKNPKYEAISSTFSEIIRELRRIKPVYPKNLFRFDTE